MQRLLWKLAFAFSSLHSVAHVVPWDDLSKPDLRLTDSPSLPFPYQPDLWTWLQRSFRPSPSSVLQLNSSDTLNIHSFCFTDQPPQVGHPYLAVAPPLSSRFLGVPPGLPGQRTVRWGESLGACGSALSTSGLVLAEAVMFNLTPGLTWGLVSLTWGLVGSATLGRRLRNSGGPGDPCFNLQFILTHTQVWAVALDGGGQLSVKLAWLCAPELHTSHLRSSSYRVSLVQGGVGGMTVHKPWCSWSLHSGWGMGRWAPDTNL